MTNLILDVSGSVDIGIFQLFLKSAKGLDSTLNVIQGSSEIEKLDENIKGTQVENIQKANYIGAGFDLPFILKVLQQRGYLVHKTIVFTDSWGLIDIRKIDVPLIIVDFFTEPYDRKLGVNDNIKIITAKNLPIYLRKQKMEKLQAKCETIKKQII